MFSQMFFEDDNFLEDKADCLYKDLMYKRNWEDERDKAMSQEPYMGHNLTPLAQDIPPPKPPVPQNTVSKTSVLRQFRKPDCSVDSSTKNVAATAAPVVAAAAVYTPQPAKPTEEYDYTKTLPNQNYARGETSEVNRDCQMYAAAGGAHNYYPDKLGNNYDGYARYSPVVSQNTKDVPAKRVNTYWSNNGTPVNPPICGENYSEAAKICYNPTKSPDVRYNNCCQQRSPITNYYVKDTRVSPGATNYGNNTLDRRMSSGCPQKITEYPAYIDKNCDRLVDPNYQKNITRNEYFVPPSNYVAKTISDHKYRNAPKKPPFPILEQRLTNQNYAVQYELQTSYAQIVPNRASPTRPQNHFFPQTAEGFEPKKYQNWVLPAEYRNNTYLAEVAKLDPKIAQDIINVNAPRKLDMPKDSLYFDPMKNYPYQNRIIYPEQNRNTAPSLINHYELPRADQYQKRPEYQNCKVDSVGIRENHAYRTEDYQNQYMRNNYPVPNRQISKPENIPRNISPRSTFQENMHTIVIHPQNLQNFSQHDYYQHYNRNACSQKTPQYSYQPDNRVYPQNRFDNYYHHKEDLSRCVYNQERRNETSDGKSDYKENKESSKEQNLKEFLENWEDDEEIVNNLPDLINNLPERCVIFGAAYEMPTNSNDKNGENVSSSALQDQTLYILEKQNISAEHLSKYQHLQQLDRLPDNIKAYYKPSEGKELKLDEALNLSCRQNERQGKGEKNNNSSSCLNAQTRDDQTNQNAPKEDNYPSVIVTNMRKETDKPGNASEVNQLKDNRKENDELNKSGKIKDNSNQQQSSENKIDKPPEKIDGIKDVLELNLEDTLNDKIVVETIKEIEVACAKLDKPQDKSSSTVGSENKDDRNEKVNEKSSNIDFLHMLKEYVNTKTMDLENDETCNLKEIAERELPEDENVPDTSETQDRVKGINAKCACTCEFLQNKSFKSYAKYKKENPTKSAECRHVSQNTSGNEQQNTDSNSQNESSQKVLRDEGIQCSFNDFPTRQIKYVTHKRQYPYLKCKDFSLFKKFTKVSLNIHKKKLNAKSKKNTERRKRFMAKYLKLSKDQGRKKVIRILNELLNNNSNKERTNETVTDNSSIPESENTNNQPTGDTEQTNLNINNEIPVVEGTGLKHVTIELNKRKISISYTEPFNCFLEKCAANVESFLGEIGGIEREIKKIREEHQFIPATEEERIAYEAKNVTVLKRLLDLKKIFESNEMRARDAEFQILKEILLKHNYTVSMLQKWKYGDTKNVNLESESEKRKEVESSATSTSVHEDSTTQVILESQSVENKCANEVQETGNKETANSDTGSTYLQEVMTEEAIKPTKNNTNVKEQDYMDTSNCQVTVVDNLTKEDCIDTGTPSDIHSAEDVTTTFTNEEVNLSRQNTFTSTEQATDSNTNQNLKPCQDIDQCTSDPESYVERAYETSEEDSYESIKGTCTEEKNDISETSQQMKTVDIPVNLVDQPTEISLTDKETSINESVNELEVKDMKYIEESITKTYPQTEDQSNINILNTPDKNTSDLNNSDNTQHLNVKSVETTEKIDQNFDLVKEEQQVNDTSEDINAKDEDLDNTFFVKQDTEEPSIELSDLQETQNDEDLPSNIIKAEVAESVSSSDGSINPIIEIISALFKNIIKLEDVEIKQDLQKTSEESDYQNLDVNSQMELKKENVIEENLGESTSNFESSLEKTTNVKELDEISDELGSIEDNKSSIITVDNKDDLISSEEGGELINVKYEVNGQISSQNSKQISVQPPEIDLPLQKTEQSNQTEEASTDAPEKSPEKSLVWQEIIDHCVDNELKELENLTDDQDLTLQKGQNNIKNESTTINLSRQNTFTSTEESTDSNTNQNLKPYQDIDQCTSDPESYVERAYETSEEDSYESIKGTCTEEKIDISETSQQMKSVDIPVETENTEDVCEDKIDTEDVCEDKIDTEDVCEDKIDTEDVLEDKIDLIEAVEPVNNITPSTEERDIHETEDSCKSEESTCQNTEESSEEITAVNEIEEEEEEEYICVVRFNNRYSEDCNRICRRDFLQDNSHVERVENKDRDSYDKNRNIHLYNRNDDFKNESGNEMNIDLNDLYKKIDKIKDSESAGKPQKCLTDEIELILPLRKSPRIDYENTNRSLTDELPVRPIRRSRELFSIDEISKNVHEAMKVSKIDSETTVERIYNEKETEDSDASSVKFSDINKDRIEESENESTLDSTIEEKKMKNTSQINSEISMHSPLLEETVSEENQENQVKVNDFKCSAALEARIAEVQRQLSEYEKLILEDIPGVTIEICEEEAQETECNLLSDHSGTEICKESTNDSNILENLSLKITLNCPKKLERPDLETRCQEFINTNKRFRKSFSYPLRDDEISKPCQHHPSCNIESHDSNTETVFLEDIPGDSVEICNEEEQEELTIPESLDSHSQNSHSHSKTEYVKSSGNSRLSHIQTDLKHSLHSKKSNRDSQKWRDSQNIDQSIKNSSFSQPKVTHEPQKSSSTENKKIDYIPQSKIKINIHDYRRRKSNTDYKEGKEEIKDTEKKIDKEKNIAESRVLTENSECEKLEKNEQPKILVMYETSLVNTPKNPINPDETLNMSEEKPKNIEVTSIMPDTKLKRVEQANYDIKLKLTNDKLKIPEPKQKFTNEKLVEKIKNEEHKAEVSGNEIKIKKTIKKKTDNILEMESAEKILFTNPTLLKRTISEEYQQKTEKRDSSSSTKPKESTESDKLNLKMSEKVKLKPDETRKKMFEESHKNDNKIGQSSMKRKLYDETRRFKKLKVDKSKKYSRCEDSPIKKSKKRRKRFRNLSGSSSSSDEEWLPNKKPKVDIDKPEDKKKEGHSLKVKISLDSVRKDLKENLKKKSDLPKMIIKKTGKTYLTVMKDSQDAYWQPKVILTRYPSSKLKNLGINNLKTQSKF